MKVGPCIKTPASPEEKVSLTCVVVSVAAREMNPPESAFPTHMISGEKIRQIESQLKEELEPCRQLSAVNDVRVLGAIAAVELKSPVDMALVQPQFVAQGVWLRPFGKLLYTMPPYIIERDELSAITKAIYNVAKSL